MKTGGQGDRGTGREKLTVHLRPVSPSPCPPVPSLEVGVDIVEISRIAQSVRNPRFLKKVFTPQEVRYCQSRKNAAQHFAVRFAAKEAVWKAVGKPALVHRDIQVRNRANGKPEVHLSSGFETIARHVSISLSHGREYAVAMAVYNRSPRRNKR